MLTFYFHAIATAMLTIAALFWRSAGGLNIIIKIGMGLSAALGGIVLASDLIARGWL